MLIVVVEYPGRSNFNPHTLIRLLKAEYKAILTCIYSRDTLRNTLTPHHRIDPVLRDSKPQMSHLIRSWNIRLSDLETADCIGTPVNVSWKVGIRY